MTRQCNDLSPTPLSNWLRNRTELPSLKGDNSYSATNIDYRWTKYRENGKPCSKWMLVEEKRHGNECKFPQSQAFQVLRQDIEKGNSDDSFSGFFIVVLEKELPSGGGIYAREYRKHCYCAYQKWCFNTGREENKEEFIAFCRLPKCEDSIEAFLAMEGRVWIQEILHTTISDRVEVDSDRLIRFLQFDSSWSNVEPPPKKKQEPPQQLTEKAERYESIIASRYG